MVNLKGNVKKYCYEDPQLIENYNLAVSDKTRYWIIHHKLEVQNGVIRSKDELIANNLYFNRPANELVWLHPSDHARLHNANRTLASKKKCAETWAKNTKIGKYKH